METLFANGHAVDIVLAVIALEFAVLLARSPSDRRAAAALTLFLALAPGAFAVRPCSAVSSSLGRLWVRLTSWVEASRKCVTLLASSW